MMTDKVIYLAGTAMAGALAVDWAGAPDNIRRLVFSVGGLVLVPALVIAALADRRAEPEPAGPDTEPRQLEAADAPPAIAARPRQLALPARSDDTFWSATDRPAR